MNELARPTLQVDLDVEIPKIPVLEHNLGVVESFATELSTFYNELLDDIEVFYDEIIKKESKACYNVDNTVEYIMDNLPYNELCPRRFNSIYNKCR